MRTFTLRLRWAVSALILFVAGTSLVRGGTAPSPAVQQGNTGEREEIFMRAVRSKLVRLGDSTVTWMVGDFLAYHNGVVIAADSAIRYDNYHVKCFGNVLINRNTTYIYGDEAEYDGLENRAEVFSPLVKVVDGDATLYTRRFSFDTGRNVGAYDQGGLMINRDNVVESERGYYYTDTHDFVGVAEVEMRNENYALRGDSVRYNTETDYAEFFENTHIWNKDNDYLYADRGEYFREDDRYIVTRNGYVLTPTREVWSDSIDYRRAEGFVVLRRHIQIDDTEHKTLALGDYGTYREQTQQALLTHSPIMIGYDTEQQPDSLFVAADTFYFYTVDPTRQAAEKAAQAAAEQADDGTSATVAGSMKRIGGLAGDLDLSQGLGKVSNLTGKRGSGEEAPDKEGPPEERSEEEPSKEEAPAVEPSEEGAVSEDPAKEAAEPKEPKEGLQRPEGGDLSAEGQAGADSLKKRSARDSLRVAAREAKAAEQKQKMEERKRRLAVIAVNRQARQTAFLLKEKARDSARMAQRRVKVERILQKRRERAIRRGRTLPDSSELSRLDSLLAGRQRADSVPQPPDSLAGDAPDSLGGGGVAPDTLAQDSIQRFARGWRHVKVYRADFQSVCDSMVVVGRDSTLHLYIDPVLWNENNQITSEVMDLYTANRKLVRGEFVGRPIMVSQIDTAYYNQVAGKEMTAWFRNNEIYRNDVNGNVQTYYYLQDDNKTRVADMMTMESGDASFYIEDKAVVGITYRSNPVFSMIPMDKMPEEQEHFLQNFTWEARRRPARDSIVRGRTIRPSLRQEREEIPRPSFPIRTEIDRQRERLVGEARWSDRDDILTPFAIEWVRSKEEQRQQNRNRNAAR